MPHCSVGAPWSLPWRMDAGPRMPDLPGRTRAWSHVIDPAISVRGLFHFTFPTLSKGTLFVPSERVPANPSSTQWVNKGVLTSCYKNSRPNAGFLYLGTIDIRGWTVLCWRRGGDNCPVQCRVVTASLVSVQCAQGKGQNLLGVIPLRSRGSTDPQECLRSVTT